MEGFTIHQPTLKQREEESGSTTSLQLAKVQVVESQQVKNLLRLSIYMYIYVS